VGEPGKAMKKEKVFEERKRRRNKDYFWRMSVSESTM